MSAAGKALPAGFSRQVALAVDSDAGSDMYDIGFLDGGLFVGRVWRDAAGGPAVVTHRDGKVVDITARAAPTVRDIVELDDPAAHVRDAGGVELCDVAPLLELSLIHI